MSKLKFKGKEVNLKGLFHTASAAGSLVSLLVMFYLAGWYTAPIWISIVLTAIISILGLVIVYHLIAPIVALTKFAKNFKVNRKVKAKADLEKRIADAKKNVNNTQWLTEKGLTVQSVWNAIAVLEKQLKDLDDVNDADKALKHI